MTAIMATAYDRRLSGARSMRIAPKKTPAMIKARWVDMLAPDRIM